MSTPPFHYGQLDVRAISAPRELATHEIHSPNDYYGQADALKRFLGWPATRPLKAVMEHGINLDDLFWQMDRDAPLPMILSCTPWRAEIHAQGCSKTAVPVGFGYLYAQEVVRAEAGPDPAEADRRGTIVFPCHSTHSIQARFDQEAYARSLAELPERFHPLFVCGYWKDVESGALEVYERQGLTLVGCGHMYDPDFMVRFHDLCRWFRYATSNAIGTHLFQAAGSGCRFFFTRSSRIEFDIPEAEKGNCGQFRPLFQQAEREAWRLFADPVEQVTSDQRAFVDRYLGTPWRKTRGELHRILQRAEWLDRTVPRRQTLLDGSRVWVPSGVARSLDRPLRRIVRIGRSIRKRLPGGRKAA